MEKISRKEIRMPDGPIKKIGEYPVIIHRNRYRCDYKSNRSKQIIKADNIKVKQ